MASETLDDAVRKMLGKEAADRLSRVCHERTVRFVLDAVSLCRPDDVFVCTGSEEDLEHVRRMALQTGEEKPLAIDGHTYHFDGPKDQGRDRKATKFLVPAGEHLSSALNQVDREKGLEEVRAELAGSMRGRTMIVLFLTLGPSGSVFSIPCVECTDSWYVAHSVNLLYRQGYADFVKGVEGDVFYTLHSCGEVDENMVSVRSDRKMIYIDYTTDTVYSVNTQYAGNSVGFKKLALRLAIRKAHREGWLAEHFMIAGINAGEGRKVYLAGAFPSACGKTSTAMLPGETILADDIAYVRKIDGVVRAVNVESGIFGIIQNVNAEDDPVIYKTLTSPGEIIFSNILVKDGRPYWIGMGEEIPDGGVNYAGEWYEGKKDEKGNEIPPSHKNARYAVALKALENCDPRLDDPEGVELGGIMFGGRDYRAYVPVQEGLSWRHGVVMYGAALETETTFAVVEAEGKYEINIMSIQDFVSIPLGEYLANHIDFTKDLEKAPIVFGVNYFLKKLDRDEFLNDRSDKHVWVKWMALRILGEVDAVETPTGRIPRYEDLKRLFAEVLGKEYAESDYEEQFTLRVKENLAKIERVRKFYDETVKEYPSAVAEELEAQKARLLDVRGAHGEYISPFVFAG